MRLTEILARLRKILAEAATPASDHQSSQQGIAEQPVASPAELQGLQRNALDVLYELGEDGSHAYREIDSLDLTGLFYNSPGLTKQEGVQIILERTKRFSDLLQLVAQKVKAAEPRHRSRRTSRNASSRARGRTDSRKLTPDRSPKPSERRARTIARLMEELNELKPQMYSETDYGRLARSHQKFLCFKIASEQPELREKIENLQAHRQHVRLALELAAAHHGVSFTTAQSDWKHHKPSAFRSRQK